VAAPRQPDQCLDAVRGPAADRAFDLEAYGLVELELLHVVAGIVIVQCAKAWFIDRMVLLFEDMKARNSEYAAWE
jgi:hypothetical protein